MTNSNPLLPKLPSPLIGLVWLICLLPLALNLLGIDFASPQPPLLGLIYQTQNVIQVKEIMYHSLSGSFLHTILEWSAFCTAIFTVILSFAHFKIKADVTTPILGVTLFCAGVMDAFHTLAADRLIEAVADNRNLIPFTWAICRVANALLTIIGVKIFLIGKFNKTSSNFNFVLAISICFGLISYGIIHFCATSETLPPTLFPQSFITRPWDVFPLVLFVISGLFIYPRFYQKYPSLFSHSLIISTIPNIATQLHMSFGSSALFDNDFNIAHFLKIIAYLVPLTGLILDYIYTHRQLEKVNKSFRQEIVERQQAEAKLQEFARREDLLRSRLSSQITHSLKLEDILKTCVAEISDLLQLDYCCFLWYECHDIPRNWQIVHEVKLSTSTSFKELNFNQDVEIFLEQIIRHQSYQIDNVDVLALPVLKNFLGAIGFSSVLTQSLLDSSGKIGILFCASHKVHTWEDAETELLKQVKEQLVIAIDRAHLYEEACQNAEQAQKSLKELQEIQTQLIQSEKMSALGNLVAGVAHEINNPVGFINGNLQHASEYTQDLIAQLQLYRKYYPQPTVEIQEFAAEIDLDYLIEDLPKLIESMALGTERIRNISTSLRTFSRADTDRKIKFNIHQGLDSTLLILKHRLRGNDSHSEIKIIKNYGKLPEINCFPGQLNQVFMNILANAIDAFVESNGRRPLPKEHRADNPSQRPNPHPEVSISTHELTSEGMISIHIQDNGPGIPTNIQQQIFDHLFTTKEVGRGTGLGLSISRQIIEEKHQGTIECISAVGRGTEFIIKIPIASD